MKKTKQMLKELVALGFSDNKIAEMAGVSQPTITRARGSQKGASEDTYFKVLKVWQECVEEND